MTNYEVFKGLHYEEEPLLLGNAWDVQSAALSVQNGYKAVATSSSAVANILGSEDGENISFSDLLFIVERIAKNIQLPLTVDIESGYSENVSQVIANIEALCDIGVAGINLEDAVKKQLVPATAFMAKLAVIKEGLAKKGKQIFINARTDAFLLKQPNALDETLARIKLYESFADSIFVPFATEDSDIKTITAATKLPVNILAVASLTSIDKLKELGVKRISMGGGLFRSAYKHAGSLLEQIKSQRTLQPLFA